jgi:iron complex transport system ATP-binding protein
MLIARLLEPGDGDITVRTQHRAHPGQGLRAAGGATLRQAPDFHLRLTVEELVAFGASPTAGVR